MRRRLRLFRQATADHGDAAKGENAAQKTAPVNRALDNLVKVAGFWLRVHQFIKVVEGNFLGCMIFHHRLPGGFQSRAARSSDLHYFVNAVA